MFGHGLIWFQRAVEDGGVRGDSQIAHHGGPPKTKWFFLLHTYLKERPGSTVVGTFGVRSVEEDVGVNRETHRLSVPSVDVVFSFMMA